MEYNKGHLDLFAFNSASQTFELIFPDFGKILKSFSIGFSGQTSAFSSQSIEITRLVFQTDVENPGMKPENSSQISEDAQIELKEEQGIKELYANYSLQDIQRVLGPMQNLLEEKLESILMDLTLVLRQETTISRMLSELTGNQEQSNFTKSPEFVKIQKRLDELKELAGNMKESFHEFKESLNAARIPEMTSIHVRSFEKMTERIKKIDEKYNQAAKLDMKVIEDMALVARNQQAAGLKMAQELERMEKQLPSSQEKDSKTTQVLLGMVILLISVGVSF